MYWYYLITAKLLDEDLTTNRATKLALRRTRKRRLWVIGSYLWTIWKGRIKETMEPGYKFFPTQHIDIMKATFKDQYDSH